MIKTSLDFEWPVDQSGYQLTEGSAVFKEIQREGGPLKYYRPIQEYPGLHRRFTALKKPDEMCEFACEFGSLYQLGHPHPQVPDGDKSESLTIWAMHIAKMKVIIECIDQGSGTEIAPVFNDAIDADMSVKLEPSAGGQFGIQVYPGSLASALWLMLANELINPTPFRKCNECPNWFPYGPGTGARKTKRFCSDRCRVAWNQSKT